MAEYNLIITDVTRYGSRYCVAGWDVVRQRMIRPEPSGANAAAEASRFWSEDHVGDEKVFSVGNKVQLTAANPPPNFPFPHATEDRIVAAGNTITVLQTFTPARMVQAVAASVSASPSQSFGGQLVRQQNGKAYVPAATKTASLGAIEIEPDGINFYSDVLENGRRRLRTRIKHKGIEYDFSVPADAAYKRFVDGGTAALVADAQGSELIHVRLGLCRPFAAMPHACYAQVNGLLFL